VPSLAVSVCPSCAVPEIDGGDVLEGGTGAAPTTLVCVEVADADPAPFVAVTTTCIFEPTSADDSKYVA